MSFYHHQEPPNATRIKYIHQVWYEQQGQYPTEHEVAQVIQEMSRQRQAQAQSQQVHSTVLQVAPGQLGHPPSPLARGPGPLSAFNPNELKKTAEPKKNQLLKKSQVGGTKRKASDDGSQPPLSSPTGIAGPGGLQGSIQGGVRGPPLMSSSLQRGASQILNPNTPMSGVNPGNLQLPLMQSMGGQLVQSPSHAQSGGPQRMELMMGALNSSSHALPPLGSAPLLPPPGNMVGVPMSSQPTTSAPLTVPARGPDPHTAILSIVENSARPCNLACRTCQTKIADNGLKFELVSDVKGMRHLRRLARFKLQTESFVPVWQPQLQMNPGTMVRTSPTSSSAC